MAETVKILFVDDEPAIRASLPAILRMHGFDVSSAANVAEALHAIAAKNFDVLISDLNIGSPGDGFTVVSAMRRTQPDCVTLILTGYPAFETALQAIRSQVDDYLIKPAGVDELVTSIENKLHDRTPRKLEHVMRVPQIVSQHADEVVKGIRAADPRFPRLPRFRSSEEEFRDDAESLISELAQQMQSGDSLLTPQMAEWSREYGRTRYQQGYSPDMLVEENRIVCAAILDVVCGNLLIVDLSNLVSDLKVLSATMSLMLREAIMAHTTTARAA
jgi:YesN/AraC family two-component response regulator